ncbi:hypothetical protein IB286_09055 [Spongiibacter sp. KMU-158]|uniref:Uncharacterized protein n=1 Tax=Spongiibacter pelagi TaxID=2760804 RepID=A0A927C0T5_9GAMM|nr:hypothetical protein [Spongiibacter pelagi]MBD2859155.1 hypothetical protein [Spongiibacter pelagi]
MSVNLPSIASCETLIGEIDHRLVAFFCEQAEGYDIPPAELYRLEGSMACLLALGLQSESQLKARLLELAAEYGDKALYERYKRDTRLYLHLAMKPAPVYPSTRSAN